MTSGKRTTSGSDRSRACPLLGRARIALLLALMGVLAAATGCQTFGRPQNNTKQQVMLDAQCPPTDPGRMPAKELAKVTLPPYVIEPPDILLIDALRPVQILRPRSPPRRPRPARTMAAEGSPDPGVRAAWRPHRWHGGGRSGPHRGRLT